MSHARTRGTLGSPWGSRHRPARAPEARRHRAQPSDQRDLGGRTPLETAAGGLLLKIAARAALTSLTGSEPCARVVTNTASTVGNAFSLAGVAHPVSDAVGVAVAFARYAQNSEGCPFELPQHRQLRALAPDTRG
jgi:hypothetical protein